MKKVIFTIALLASTATTQANNFSMPGFGNNNNGFNNGSSWSMPNMNWGNGNGYNNGSNWNMPNMNGGNNNNGYNNGSNWNMPNMNWGNSNNGNGFNNGSSWAMPNMNWGNGGNNNQPWNFGNSFGNGYNGNNRAVAPNMQYRAPVAPQYNPRVYMQNKAQVAPIAKKPTVKAITPTIKTAPAVKGTVKNKIPMPSEVKGTILAPANKVKVEATK